MKTISKIHIHLFFYIVAIVCALTGYFKDFIYITILIYFHELGHITGALYYKWNIDKILILPFGGITIFKESLNKSIKEEFIILILGPLYQIIMYIIISEFFNVSNSNFFSFYHYSLLFFNLLPIIPLDGSKLLNLFLNIMTSFKISHRITIVISFLMISAIFITSFFSFNLVLILIVFFLFLKTIEDNKRHNMIFNKFLLERYIYTFISKKRKIINGNKIYKIKRDFIHLFYIDNKYITEKEILRKKFDFKSNLW